MKKWILVGLLIVIMGLSVGSISLNKKFNLSKNMVNATVLIDKDNGYGSGVFIYDDVILTAAHCLEDVNAVSIELSDGTILESSDFYIDEKEDIGFIFVKADELAIAKISDTPWGLGDTIFLVGTPYNRTFKFSLFRGIISHLDRDIPRLDWKDLLQVDADGGMGNSGGPLYNVDGRLIGMYVGQCNNGGKSISLCESAESILEAYQRCKNAVDF